MLKPGVDSAPLRHLAVLVMFLVACLWAGGASCVRSEAQPEEGHRLRDLTFGPGAKAYTNETPERPTTAGPNTPKMTPTSVKPPPDLVGGPPGAEMLNPIQREKFEAQKYLRTQPGPGKLICTALDPNGRRPLAVRIHVVAADKTVDGMTDPLTGIVSFDLSAGRTQIYCLAGEYYTPYTNEIDVKPGENKLEVLLTEVPELAPDRFGFVTLSLAHSARLDRVAAERAIRAGQADFGYVLQPRAAEQARRMLLEEQARNNPTPPPDRPAEPTAVDGPYGGFGSRFVGLGMGPPPELITAPVYDLRDQPRKALPAQANLSDPDAISLSDDLYRLKQAGFLRVWLYPSGVTTRPDLVKALQLPERQFQGSEGFLAAERGAGLDLVTLGPQGEGEAPYFELLNRGVSVAALAEPVDVDAVPVASAGSYDAAAGKSASYQALPQALYDSVVTPRTLVQIDGYQGGARPDLATTLAWLKAGQAQVAYGPVLSWRMREFKEVVGYAAQPVPAANRLYHLDVNAFIGPGAPPEFHSIQLIQLLRNGVVVASLPVDRPLQTVRDLTFEIHETATAWYMLRAYSGPPADNQRNRAAGPAAGLSANAVVVEVQPNWRRSWSAPIHFAAVGDTDAGSAVGEPGVSLPVAVYAFAAVDNTPMAADVIVTRGGYLVSKTALPTGRGAVQARVGDHILVGGKNTLWNETVVSPYENLNGDPWRSIRAKLKTPKTIPVEDARAANARLSGMGLLCPMVRLTMNSEPPQVPALPAKPAPAASAPRAGFAP